MDPPLPFARSFPVQTNELSDYPQNTSPIDEDWSDDDHWERNEQDWLLKRSSYNGSHYGGSLPANRQPSSKKKKSSRRISNDGEESAAGINVASSFSNLANKFFNKIEDASDDEAPPTIEMKYKRSKLDWIKLVLLPILYLILMGVAIVFAFYTIEGLLESYKNRVRSVEQIDVDGRYSPIGIAIFPSYSEYKKCEYRYYDNLSPSYGNSNPGPCGDYQLPFNCFIHNVSFNSTIVQNLTRQVLVFQGPTLVQCKQSLKLSFGIDTSQRVYSTIEYILFDDWEAFNRKSKQEQQDYLAYIEQNRTVYTFPAGFQTWVKMSYSIYQNFGNKKNYTEFNIIDSYASYNEYNDTYMPMEVLFEWKDNHYDYIQEIVSTTVWSAFGSFCGLLLTVVKVGEFGKAWIRRFRRDKQKKRIHFQKLEEEQKRQMELYEERKKKRSETKLKQSMEATRTITINN